MAQPAPLITHGIGPGGSILYLMTGGLDIGAAIGNPAIDGNNLLVVPPRITTLAVSPRTTTIMVRR